MATEWDPVDNADPDFEWDETLERVLQSAEESFFSTQQQVPHLNQPPLTHEHFSEALAEGPVETHPPEIRPFPRDNHLYNITRDTQGYPGSLIPHPFPAPPETTHQGYSEPNRPEIATLKEELSKLREENRQLGLIKEELLTQKYTREGEIAIIRKRLVKSEAENTQLQESVNQFVNQHHREKEDLRNQLESELAQLRTDLEFKQQELIALQMTPVPTRSTIIMPSPASTSESSIHSRRPLPSADDFLDASAFYAPPDFRTTARSESQTTTPVVEVEPTPSKPVGVSVGIMTDPWPQSPTPQREVQDSTELSQPDPTGQFGSTAPQSTSAGDPPSSAPALVAFTQLQHWYSFISKSCPFDRLNQTYFQLTQMLTRYQSVCLSSALARGIVAYIRTLVCDALAFIPRDHSKVRDFEPPAVDTSENEADASMALIFAVLMPLVLTDKVIPLAVHNDMVVNTPTLERWLAFTFRTTSHGTMSDESTRTFQQSVHAYNGDCSSQLVARLVTFIPDTLSYYQFLIQPENVAQVLLVINPSSAVLPRWLEIYGYLWLDPTVGTVCVRDTTYAMRFVNILCELLRTLVESPPHGAAIPSLATQRALVRVLFLWTKCYETQLLPQLIQCEPLLTVLLDALTHHCHALEQLPCNTTIYFDHQTLIQDTLSILHFLLTRAPQPSKYLIKPLDPKTNTYRLLLPSFPTSATERVPLFYLYLETMGRLACRYEEHSLSPEFTNQAKDLLALVLTAQEEEQVLRLISPLN